MAHEVDTRIIVKEKNEVRKEGTLVLKGVGGEREVHSKE